MSDSTISPSDDADRLILELAKVSMIRLRFAENIAPLTEEEWDRAIARRCRAMGRYVEPRSIVIPEDGTQE